MLIYLFCPTPVSVAFKNTHCFLISDDSSTIARCVYPSKVTVAIAKFHTGILLYQCLDKSLWRREAATVVPEPRRSPVLLESPLEEEISLLTVLCIKGPGASSRSESHYTVIRKVWLSASSHSLTDWNLSQNRYFMAPSPSASCVLKALIKGHIPNHSLLKSRWAYITGGLNIAPFFLSLMTESPKAEEASSLSEFSL